MTGSLPPEDDRGGIEVPTEGRCMECGERTNRVDICFEAHLHYDCAPEADRKYWDAVRAEPWSKAILDAVFPEGAESDQG